MTSISLRLDNEIFSVMRKKARKLHVSQTEYIRQAILLLNQALEKKERKAQMKKASLLTRQESMKVNKEFGDIEYDITD